MRLLFVADGRSPTALSWLRHWIDSGHLTHLISTFPCVEPPGLESFHILPLVFSGVIKASTSKKSEGPNNHNIAERIRNKLRPIRYIAGPLSLPLCRSRFRNLVDEIHPDLVHALRIPFEGMLAFYTPAGTPLVVSIWGNDITLHATGSIFMKSLTRRTLRRADGLLADAKRDIRLGHEWGFASDKPTLVVPGAGGIRLDEMKAPLIPGVLPEELPEVPIVINPRGQRPGSLRQDVFFRSIPLVIEKFPESLFVCPNLAGNAEAEHWVELLGIRSNTKLWPHLERAQMWRLYNKAWIFVSPSIHDGTPNSLLEAMASGCFPVVGNIESMQEWVKPGVNGLLVDATSPSDLANKIIAALGSRDLLATAKNENARIIAERATYEHCMAMAEAFYYEIGRGISKEKP
jgi:glycosyltransferase involved in cell wall biosynthesis